MKAYYSDGSSSDSIKCINKDMLRVALGFNDFIYIK